MYVKELHVTVYETEAIKSATLVGKLLTQILYDTCHNNDHEEPSPRLVEALQRIVDTAKQKMGEDEAIESLQTICNGFERALKAMEQTIF
jgi:hypothetical protein